jgi:predicted acyltransferase
MIAGAMASVAPAQATSTRLASLDAFRGATIALMALVNTPGDGQHVYWPLEHADWHGWTPTDVVFPSFLWIAGLSMTLSFAKRLRAGATRADLFRQAAKRAGILFLIGLLIYGFPRYDLTTLRFLGVLQRIAICGLAGAAIWLTTGTRGRIAWLVSLLLGYWALMTFVPVPGYGAGRLDVDGNLAHYVDRVVLGAHNYASTKTWDPEGIVSTLPAIGTFIFGLLAGEVMARREPLARRLVRLAAIGVVLLAIAMAWNEWLPINKKLWTSTFAVFMAGLDFVLLAGFAWLVDGLGWTRPVRPFVILGMNSIAIYVASEFLDQILWMAHVRRPIYEHLFVPIASPYNASVLYALAYVGVMFVLAWVMYRRGWFVRI